jgi:hypothetical protein
LSVGFDYNPAAEVIQDEGLVGFGESEFPRQSGVFDGGLGGGSGTTVEAGDEYYIGVGFGYACGDRADSDFGYQFDVNSGISIGIFEIVD